MTAGIGGVLWGRGKRYHYVLVLVGVGALIIGTFAWILIGMSSTLGDAILPLLGGLVQLASIYGVGGVIYQTWLKHQSKVKP